MNEEQYEFDGSTYLLTKLPLGTAKETLLRLTQMGLFSGEDAGMTDVLSKLRVKDLDFFEDKLFGRHLQLMNENGAWVPMGKPLTANHFDGRLGAYMHMVARALMFNFASFLDDLHIDALTGATEGE
jgi:hypothetical protein